MVVLEVACAYGLDEGLLSIYGFFFGGGGFVGEWVFVVMHTSSFFLGGLVI